MFELFRRIHYLIHRRRLDAELANDMEFHREMAARAGQRNFGNVTRLREQAFEAAGWSWLDRLVQDLRYGARILAQAPMFTITAVLVLAVGIGVNVAAFSVFEVVALKALPVRDGDRLVRLERRSPSNYTSEMAYPSFLFYREHAKTLSATMAVLGVPPMQLNDDNQPASASFVTENYFTELGSHAAYGRLIDPAIDSTPDAAPVVVLSHGIWQRRFGGDPTVVGRVMHINGKPATVIGVTPHAFASLGAQHPDLWMPIGQQPYFLQNSRVLWDWTSSSVRMWGKLASGTSAKTAEQELKSLTALLHAQHPEAVWDDEYIQSSPGGHLEVLQPEMYQVAAMVGVLTMLILLLSCANLGGLMLARGVSRQHEISIRIALGAGRRRIFRQLCTESLMLAAMGAVVGLALACGVVRLVLMIPDAPGWVSVAPDWRVVLFTMGMTFVATMFFGLMPALRIARQGRQKTVARQFLVGAQIAASSILIIVAALLLRATQHALYADPGFGYEQMVSVDPQLGRHGYSPERARSYLEQMESRLRAEPGVVSVSLVKLPPLGHIVARSSLEVGGRTVSVYPNFVAPDFFRTMEIPLLLGRTFDRGEKNAVIVSDSFAKLQWPGKNPLGQSVGEGPGKSTVIGVVGDAHINARSDNDAVEQYWPPQPDDMPDMVLIVRASGEPGSLTPALKAMSSGLDASLFPEIRQLRVLFNEDVQQIEAAAAVVSLSGLLAVSLAAMGIFGLVAFVVTQRSREIAIRLALGARRASILNAVLRPFGWPMVLGMAAGTTFAALGSKLLRVLLYGVSNLDLASYLAALLLLSGIALTAVLLPAARSLRLDLAAVLHND